MYCKCEEQIAPNQFGFIIAVDTREGRIHGKEARTNQNKLGPGMKKDDSLVGKALNTAISNSNKYIRITWQISSKKKQRIN